jgi:hypothetical protein
MKNCLQKISLAIMAVAIFGYAGLGLAADTMSHENHDMKKSESKTSDSKTIEGEIIDTQCYAENGARGEEHASCAEKCIKGGSPVGLLDSDGHLYIVLGEGHKAASEVVKGHVGHIVKATGKVQDAGGTKFIIVSNLTHVSSEPSVKESKENQPKEKSKKSSSGY